MVLRIFVFVGTVWALAFTLLMIEKNLTEPDKFQESDYVMTFYVAGHLVASGQASHLYPTSTAPSFANSRFNQAAHQLLPHLPKKTTAVFMYSPPVAWMFAPLSMLGPTMSLVIWQLISIVSLLLSAFFLSRSTGTKTSDIFFLSFLFFPIITTLWGGQVSLAFGLLPLSGGYLLLRKDRPILAGLVWSLIVLKPQFVFVPAFVITTLIFSRRYECCRGFVVGVVGLAALNTIFVPMDVTYSWLHSLRLGEALFSSVVYEFRDYLVTSLPANILLNLPAGLRTTVKWPIYFAAVILWLSGMWNCKKLVQPASGESRGVSLTLVVALILLPLTSPYLLFYDLCIILPAGAILLGNEWPMSPSRSLTLVALIGWTSINCYMVIFMIAPAQWAQPLALQLVLLVLFVELYRTVNQWRAVSERQ